MCELRPDPETLRRRRADRRGMTSRRTEHKSLQGVTEQSQVGAVETKDIAGPADEAEPTVSFLVSNWTHDHQGNQLAPEQTVTLPVSLARSLAPVYGRILD